MYIYIYICLCLCVVRKGLGSQLQTFINSFRTTNCEEIAASFAVLPSVAYSSYLLGCIGIDWNFDMIAFSEKTENVLLEVGYTLLSRVVCEWECDENILLRFLLNIQNQYLPNPYHNKLHAATVAHLTECLVKMLNAQRT